MKLLTHIARFIVGALFIFSGFIKLNDPLGFSYKLQEYFSAEVLGLEFLSPYALLIAIILVVVEVLLGIALLVGYRKKITLWLLFAMIAFFTFLTFYSAYFNKVTDCGCFGDAIPLVPWESFAKDVILLVLILFLMFNQKYILPLFGKLINTSIVFVSFLACMFFGMHVLEHLPWLDFRAYKVGSNIAEGMKIPEGATEATFEYQWKFNIDGKEEVITTEGGYPQVDGEFISYEVVQTAEGYEPPVHDFTIERGEENYTTEFLEKENLVVIVAYNLTNTEREGYYNIRTIAEDAIRKGYNVIGLSSSSQDVTDEFVQDFKLPFKFYFTDETVLKTIVRANPGIVSLHTGTILQKLHYNDAQDLRLQALENSKPNLDFTLKYELDSIAILDQKYRRMMYLQDGEEKNAEAKKLGVAPEEFQNFIWKQQELLDSINLERIEYTIKTKGYPGKSIVGEPTNTAAWYVIQHNPDKIPTYIDTIKKAGKDGELPYRLVAMMEDRLLMSNCKPQIYGTQGATYPNMADFIWPIANPQDVNKRRAAAGFPQTIEQYGKDLFGQDFEYKEITLDEALAAKQQMLEGKAASN
ncbi:putative membrane protein YphA (DoxX/SURF4 family) [Dokdonia sp. Hel_I_63]|uniref:BT_3928 family protein n=1 Tax=Dokdonia sp. Hel_I_63 TaxID=1249996 RepID=UPI0011996DB8|nr:BT_3928 family protein [Dokdonia sp. Hel_I_63]TVZ23676.1 putative membrane protein YphA (DoxX/SURF4 family) [Dokdonia sp. Hel_I_63]